MKTISANYFIGSVHFQSELIIEKLGQLLSAHVLSGIQLGGLERAVYDEVPAIYNDFLNMAITLQGYSNLDDEGIYILEIATYGIHNKLKVGKCVNINFQLELLFQKILSKLPAIKGRDVVITPRLTGMYTAPADTYFRGSVRCSLPGLSFLSAAQLISEKCLGGAILKSVVGELSAVETNILGFTIFIRQRSDLAGNVYELRLQSELPVEAEPTTIVSMDDYLAAVFQEVFGNDPTIQI